MKLWRGAEKLINITADLMGRIGWLLVLYCMIFGVTDVFLRYIMNAPSQWIGTTIQAAVVLMACVGGPYALNHDAFVKLDLFYARARTRTKAILDVVTASFSLMFLVVLIWKGTGAALVAIKINQITPTAIPIPIYPLKTAIPIAAVLVLLVVIKQLVHDIRTIVFGDPREEDPIA